MYLSKLDIHGFKSFAQKTKFELTSGLSAFVGPNGCGKTNIVDAIRWVLGEQKTSVLRSDIMEDVIFNGTKTRKPLGMAEVSLTLQNTKKILPVEYSEVTISRRLFRNGDSQYLLNKVKCRLRDIIDLFMDTGMGADSYSVIELKMVEALLSGKIDERRHLFEEAAGVNKYKVRRKEAGRKLSTVQSDLVRVQDIETEIRKNVSSLSRQAAKTRRYNKLLEELKSLEVLQIKHDFALQNKKKTEIAVTADSLKENKSRFEIELNEIEKEKDELNKKLSILDEDYRKALEEDTKINNSIAKNNQDIAVANEKLSNLNNTHERLKKEIEEAEKSSSKTTETLERTQQRVQDLLVIKEQADTELTESQAKYDDARDKVKNMRQDAASINEKILTLQNKINSFKENAQRNESRKLALEDKIADSSDEIKKINQQKEEIEKSYNDALQRKEQVKSELNSVKEKLKVSLKEKSQLQEKLEEVGNVIDDEKRELNQKIASRDFLAGLIDSAESSVLLMNSQSWQPSVEKILLAETVGTDEKFRIAVEAALGEAAQYFVVKNRDEAFAAFNLLSENKKGKATFICRDEVPKTVPPPAAPSSEQVFGWVSEIVRVDDCLRSALRGLLGRTLIAASIEQAIDYVDSGKADSAVTFNGELVGKNGIIRGGAVSSDEGIAVGKRERIDNLNIEIESKKSEIDKFEAEFNSIKEKLSSIKIHQINEQIREIENEKDRNELTITQLINKRELLDDNLILHEDNTARYSEEIDEISLEESGFHAQLSDFEESLFSAKNDYNDKQKQLRKTEEERSKLEKDVHDKDMAFVRLNADIDGLHKEIKRLEQQLLNFDELSKQRQQDLLNNKGNIKNVESQIETLKNELSNLEDEELKAKNECDFLDDKIKSLKEQIDQKNDGLYLQRKKYEKLLENIYDQDLIIGELRALLRNLLITAKERFDLDLEDSEFVPPEDFSIEECRANVSNLRSKLNLLGSVNFLALDEYDKESERLRFYNNQIDDLIKSEKILQETIFEIDQVAEDKFLETFKQVQKYFGKLFKKLFGTDGEARIVLGEGNPLEADIEIIAKPPGKKPLNIEMISSGEKTLTAIALLFSIYLVKPSPFCILDEVDAPLDDANIDRFIELIRDFSTDTQFLIVTHNKKTMEAADTLYGITMLDDGISKVVSVRLSPELV